MTELNNTLVRQSNSAQSGNVIVGDTRGICIDSQSECDNRLQPRLVQRVCALGDKLLDFFLGGIQAMVEDRAKRCRTVWAAVCLGHRDSDVLYLIHLQFARLPKDFSCSQFRFEELWEVHLDIEVVGNRAFHLRNPMKNVTDCRIISGNGFDQSPYASPRVFLCGAAYHQCRHGGGGRTRTLDHRATAPAVSTTELRVRRRAA
jgi:hypothetical protein